MMEKRRPVVCILGPTGAGKTATSLGMARKFPVRVINFDSRQVYTDFPVITAQPSPEERAVCPHELYGFLPTTETINASGFVDLAKERIDAAEAGELPVLVGGTGMYLQSLISGLAPIPDIPDEIRERIRKRSEEEGGPALYAELEKVDPEYCKRTHPNNRQRNARALEVYEATGKPFSWWHNREVPPSPYNFLKIGIKVDLDELTPLLKLRIEKMLEAGAVEEARKAWENCPDENAPGWTGIGCIELMRYIKGEIDLDETIRLWAKNTRAYAKRQLTWFKREKDIHWFAPHEYDKAVTFVGQWLAD
ncbi:tRNA (adenosine(37)-N6)-dimethylallyltransferase MiaA [Maridesulfovibrio salexigens]|uniref:tRNA dimethylallyltransferase n=1 Tax=Maridesulfovibrio salexigens (strain ATCC 14822 / DSM 2638 / NCIMB 8403 / VKM B-1763) TaxID=526222 RepID=MIAA_MARSD|nr:tRNA (adenosine(37)-N6)-dimethylallyltransferase MiaA [Maridesulfovibrio salexigens]C6BXG0.1 RecName: Full=tRNA dimethylallyltransferase; AltName: Full=Dimethylallyl diphosphate:tRNA dimethylallyltransferase; Short=DMAPP:tRNA dimethylallyltransferase; Short=DMATase; AltName: Full=Isopentenyl-diphosphate:tRNA isopentenyltransferase; Short=IPP transferase; Short=IPPT; Short=IPTase [Maridesulfovibrio salexigens DSM 2638]ACS80466.1 tRNA delta(2)-isopentenylpyrophosphate transferase [Maridesulfovib